MSSNRLGRWLALVGVCGLAVVSGCQGDEGVVPTVPPTFPVPEPLPTAPVPGSTVATSVPSSSSTDESAAPIATNLPTTTLPVVPSVPSFGVLPEGIGVPVASAPEVATPGDIRELADRLWVFLPSEPDLNDINVVPPLPEDIEIIAAYLEESMARNEMITQRPILVEPTARYAAIRVDGGVSASDGLRERAASGQYYDMREGTVLRPHVVVDGRTETSATIYDCQIIRSGWVNADGSAPVPVPEGFGRFPQTATLTKVDGRWLVDTVTKLDGACL